MAYLAESQAERDRRQQQEQEQGQQGPAMSGPSGVITGGGGQGAAQPQGQQQASRPGGTSSGQFTNINRYLNLNRDQASNLSGRVAQNVRTGADQAKQQVQGVQQQFNQQAQAGGVSRDKNLVNEAVTNATQFVQDKNRVGQFQGMLNAQYRGPRDLTEVQGFSQAQGAVNRAAQDVDATRSEAGRFRLLREQFARPTYQRGQQRLDQLLLQNSADARQQFGQVQQDLGNVGNVVNQAQTQAQQTAQARQAETEAARQDAQQALQGARTAQRTAIDQRVTQQRQQQGDLFNRIRQQIADPSKGFDEDVMQALGLQDGEHLYDFDTARAFDGMVGGGDFAQSGRSLNLNDFVGEFNPDDITARNVATADDYAQYAALAQLAGENPQLLINPSEAGTAPSVRVDRDRLRQSINQNQSVAQQRRAEADRAAAGSTAAGFPNLQQQLLDMNRGLYEQSRGTQVKRRQ